MTEKQPAMKVFISGIGGSGTRMLAKYFLKLGYEVFGSDLNETDTTKELSSLGSQIFYGESNLEKIEELAVNLHIYSAALKADHPEREYFSQSNVESREVGEFTDQLLDEYFNKTLRKAEINAIKEVQLAPLLEIDWNKKKYVAVTGTDGKSTTSTMIYHLLQKMGKSVAMITTLGMEVNGQLMETGLHTTTPSAQELYELLSDKQLADVEVIILETTSHGLAMGRLAGSKFDVGVVTNITSEHLDYHKTWENYFASKARLLTKHLKPTGAAVLNPFDERSYVALEKICEANNINYTHIDVTETEKVALSDENDTNYNRQNGSQAVQAVRLLFPEEEPLRLYAALHSFRGLSGRMEIMQTDPFTVIVDFAHTANALQRVLEALRERLPEGKGIHVVFGCAGMRDKGKRAPMGKAASDLADAIYICPEDPRLEKLADINREILIGAGMPMHSPELAKLEKEDTLRLTLPNGKGITLFQEFSPKARYDAIAAAIAAAQPGDIVVLCGKGHEKSLCFNTTEEDWSDQEAVKEILSDS